MKRITAATAALAMALVACGGGDDRARTISAPTQTEPATSDATSPAAAETEAAEEAPGEFSEVLLTLDDMPSGWTTAPEMLEDDDSGSNFCNAEEDVLDIEDEAERTAEAAFKESDFGPFVLHSVGELSDKGRAEEALDTFLAEAEGCTEWTETEDDGSETTWRLSPLSFPNLGDGSVAFRMSSSDGPMPFAMDLVVWHEGPRMAFVAYVALGATDGEEFERLALEAADRL